MLAPWGRWCSCRLPSPTSPLLGHLSSFFVLPMFLTAALLSPFLPVLSHHIWGQVGCIVWTSGASFSLFLPPFCLFPPTPCPPALSSLISGFPCINITSSSSCPPGVIFLLYLPRYTWWAVMDRDLKPTTFEYLPTLHPMCNTNSQTPLPSPVLVYNGKWPHCVHVPVCCYRLQNTHTHSEKYLYTQGCHK